MVTFFLCDDNRIILDKFADDLDKLAKEEHLNVAIRTFESGEALLFELADEPNAADVIFLDVLMGKTNGIETAKKLRELGCLAEIVFLTSSEEFVFDSFDANPFYYLLKNDATEDKFKEIVLRVYHAADDKVRKVFRCEYKGVSMVIPYGEILYFEVDNRMVTVHYNDETFSFYSTMDALCKEVDPGEFTRTHRSFLVNIKHIKGVVRNGVTLSNGLTIPASETHSKEMRLAIMKYYGG